MFSAVRVQTQQRPICPPLYLLPLPAPLRLYCADCGLAIKSQFNKCNSAGGGGRKQPTSPTSVLVVGDIFQKYRDSHSVIIAVSSRTSQSFQQAPSHCKNKVSTFCTFRNVSILTSISPNPSLPVTVQTLLFPLLPATPST